jgi:hypothetical protein
VLRIFIALKNPSPWPDFEAATFGSSGQHTNHYTTKATQSEIKKFRCLSEATSYHHNIFAFTKFLPE